MSLPDREFITLLLRRDKNASEDVQQMKVGEMVKEMQYPPLCDDETIISGWQIVGFGWGNEFDNDEAESDD